MKEQISIFLQFPNRKTDTSSNKMHTSELCDILRDAKGDKYIVLTQLSAEIMDGVTADDARKIMEMFKLEDHRRKSAIFEILAPHMLMPEKEALFQELDETLQSFILRARESYNE